MLQEETERAELKGRLRGTQLTAPEIVFTYSKFALLLCESKKGGKTKGEEGGEGKQVSLDVRKFFLTKGKLFPTRASSHTRKVKG